MNVNLMAPYELRRGQARSHRRLGFATLASAVIICSAIVLLPGSFSWQPQLEYSEPIQLQLVQPAKDELPEDMDIGEQPAEALAEQLAEDFPGESQADVDIESDPHEQPTPAVDWYAVMQEAVRSDKLYETRTMHPEFDEQRRVARLRFRKSEAPVEKPIWENVEKDQTGRTILRAGDCYRVLDDPRVTNQWAQETFGQYMIYCEGGKSGPKELPFVEKIVERYAYLRHRDNEETLTGIFPPQ
jgi:hypothetical protein